jgi:hypothetical protein
MANKEKTLEELKVEVELAQKAYADALRVEEQKKKTAEEKRMAKLAVEKEKRKKEVDDAIDNAIELIKKYIKDYGSFSVTDHVNDLSFLFGSKPWRLFL